MRLKSLEIQGFKSFPEKTLLTFNKGITVIIGPNGSGKSNISDAVKWVLGELSSKSIRGTKMEDVIFGGTDKVKQMNFAEVSLTIDNTEDRINSDYDEITVTRRYYRTGESDYMINRKYVRLKDINELFLNTGIGHSSYSIIGQGKVAEILSQKSDDRRVIFEEAAGISKYRYQKNEAEHKLASTEDNILRITDILGEIGERTESLRVEAARAHKYLEAYEAKKRADVSLFVYDMESFRSQYKLFDDKYKISEHELEITEDSINSIEKQIETLYTKSNDNKLKIEQIDRKLKENNSKINEFNGKIQLFERDIEHIDKEIDNNYNELVIKNEMLLKEQERAKITLEKYNDIEKICADIEKDYNGSVKECENIEFELADVNTDLNLNTEKITKNKNLLNFHNIELAALDATNASSDNRSEELQIELESCIKYNENLSKQINDINKSVSDYDKQILDCKNQISEHNDIINSFNVEKSNIEQKISSVNMDILSLKQRTDTLTRMEELFEGYSNSIKFVMNNVHRNNYGPVSRLIDVKPMYTIAIETALGNNIQNIVTHDENTAKSAIKLLKEKNAGRVTFYPLTNIIPTPLNYNFSEFDDYEGYIGLASELVAYNEKFKNVINYLLGRTIVFDNIDNALIMAKDYDYSIRIVTLDGQLVNVGGSITGGSVKGDSGILTRNTEIEAFAKEIETHNISLKALTDNLNGIEFKINKQKDESIIIQNELTLIAEAHQHEKTKSQILQSQLNSNNQRIETINNNINDIVRIKSEYVIKRENLVQKTDEVKKNIRLDEEKILSSTAVHTELTEKFLKHTSKKNDLWIKLSLQKKDIESALNTLTINNETIKSIENQISKIDQLTYSHNENIIKLTNQIEETKRLASGLTTDCKNLEESYAECHDKIFAYEKQTEELRKRSQELARKKELLFRENTKLESKRREILSEQDKLVAKLWEDYELTYSTAIELDYPSVDEKNRSKVVAAQNENRTKLREIGPVNVNSINEYKEVKERFDFLTAQLDDLNKSKITLNNIISKLESEMRIKFTAVMNEINHQFYNVFRELFGGGSAELVLTTPDNVLESGIEINVAPPGKIIKNLSLLSGGEQSFVAIALLFAILKVNPSPFCLFDEIEAALDETNILKFTQYCCKYAENTQFVIITHRRSTMEIADVLYGITMYEKGISKVLSVNVGDLVEV
ncbi:MAG: chromosome segregation protein SMC [Oscillospiraceae bacterium]|nr:chromosome segregation protein SMC [Oscillospiraceae bacterium]